MINLVFIGSLLVFMLISVPIAFSLGLATALGVALHETLPLTAIPQRIFVGLNSFPLMAIPFFILAGSIMQYGGIAQRLVNFSMSLIGHITGGLAMVAIVTSMFFAAISGSGTATTAAIGAILIPAMIAYGYSKEYTSANQAAAGSLGVILPPSIPMILYGVTAGVSISDMFLAGIFPGLLVMLSLLIMAFFISKRRGYVGVEKSSWSDIWKTFKQAIWALLMPVFILGGIYTGLFTPTEAAVIAVVFALVVSMFIYKEMAVVELGAAFKSAALMTSMVMIIIGTAGLFGYFINIMGIPNIVTHYMDLISINVFVFLLIMNILLLLVGMFLETSPAILIFVPLFLPVAQSLGIDPVHFGMIMIVNLGIGFFTPPLGLNLFVVFKLTDIRFMQLSKAVVPFVIVMFIDVLIISYVPALSTWLPSVLQGN